MCVHVCKKYLYKCGYTILYKYLYLITCEWKCSNIICVMTCCMCYVFVCTCTSMKTLNITVYPCMVVSDCFAVLFVNCRIFRQCVQNLSVWNWSCVGRWLGFVNETFLTCWCVDMEWFPHGSASHCKLDICFLVQTNPETFLKSFVKILKSLSTFGSGPLQMRKKIKWPALVRHLHHDWHIIRQS
jgi:hypothetical protein